jgi:hypothetical protein
MLKTATREPERLLVELLIAFVNQPAPEDAAAVEAHFRQHPWTTRLPWLSVTSDPPEKAVAAFRSDHTFARAEVARIVRTHAGPARAALRRTIAQRLSDSLTMSVPVRGAGLVPLPLGTWAIDYRRGELALTVRPFVTGVAAAITFGLALLLDSRRDFGRALLQCQTCHRIFRRTRSHQAYCSGPCKEQGTRARNRDRQWRLRHPQDAEEGKES